MTSHYCTVYYVPDALFSERICLGWFTFSRASLVATKRPDLSELIGSEGERNLYEAFDNLIDTIRSLANREGNGFMSAADYVYRNWCNQIQIGSPRASIRSPEGLSTSIYESWYKHIEHNLFLSDSLSPIND